MTEPSAAAPVLAPVEQWPWLQDAQDAFRQRLEHDRLGHALLLSGPEGLGKTRLALAWAAALLCLEPRGATACGECRSCRLLPGGAHPDRFLVHIEEGAKIIAVDQVRKMLQSLTLTTTVGPRKVALIAPAEAMNRNAQNALLKNLEEPPGEAVLLLVSHYPPRLEATVLSRCQQISVGLPAPEIASQWLQSELGIEGGGAEDALAAAGGSPLIAAAMWEQEVAPAFGRLRARLEGLSADTMDVQTAVAETLGEVDPDTRWRWLSTLTADRVRAAPPRQLAAALIGLQEAADRNRKLASSSVRQDLLLRAWLIEWRTRTQG